MSRASRFGAEVRPGLAELERRCPEWRGWLRMLGEAFRACEDPGWDRCAASLDAASAERNLGEGAPLLHRQVPVADGGRARGLLKRLAVEAGLGGGPVDAILLLEASIRQDESLLARVAAGAGLESRALGPVAHLLSLPLLEASARRLAGLVPRTWPHGHCPVCGAWPLLAELRGIERERRLRCGRCGSDWRTEWLSCAYCGEQDHTRLGSLVPEEAGDTRRVETCATCGHYLKQAATLSALPLFALLLRDLESVELDLAAAERGWSRPAGPGYALSVRVEARRSRLDLRRR